MKPNTRVWVGLRHVGDAGMPDRIAEMSVRESVLAFIELVTKNSLAKRMEIVIARTEGEVVDRLNEKRGGVGSRLGAANDSMMDEFQKMLDEVLGDE